MSRVRGRSWTADVTSGTTRVRRGGFATKATADRYKAEVLVALEQGLVVPEPDLGSGAAKDPSFMDALRAGSIATWGGCSSRVQNEVACFDFANVLAQGRGTPVRAVSDGHLMTWAAQLEARGNAAATVNRKLTAVSAILDYAYKAQLIGRKPVIPWRQVEGGRIVVLTETQVVYFMDRLPDYRDFIGFLLETGMRRGEALKFTAEHCTTAGQINLPGSITKSGRARTVPLTREAQRLMKAWLHSACYGGRDSRVWGCRIDGDVFTKAFRDARLGSPWAANEELTPHALRHTCATRLIRKGVLPVIVQRWLGHATLEQTMAYVHLDDDDLQAAAAAL